MTTKLVLESVPSSYFPFLHSVNASSLSFSSSDQVKGSRLVKLYSCGGLLTQMGLRGHPGASRPEMP